MPLKRLIGLGMKVRRNSAASIPGCLVHRPFEILNGYGYLKCRLSISRSFMSRATDVATSAHLLIAALCFCVPIARLHSDWCSLAHALFVGNLSSLSASFERIRQSFVRDFCAVGSNEIWRCVWCGWLYSLRT
jgi:hypothetical protein